MIKVQIKQYYNDIEFISADSPDIINFLHSEKARKNLIENIDYLRLYFPCSGYFKTDNGYSEFCAENRIQFFNDEFPITEYFDKNLISPKLTTINNFLYFISTKLSKEIETFRSIKVLRHYDKSINMLEVKKLQTTYLSLNKEQRFVMLAELQIALL